LGVIGWLVAFLSLTVTCLAQVGGETTSLDSSTNGITFKKLPSVEVVLDNEPKPIELKLDVLRADVAYELVVYIINNSSAEFLPVKASTSCNCVVGAVPSSSIEPDEKGPIVVRLKPKKYSSQLRQLVRVEGSDGRCIDLNIKADVNPDFVVSRSEFQVSKDNSRTEIDLELVPMYPNIVLESVRVQFQSSLFRAASIIPKDGKLKLKLEPTSSFDRSVTKEFLEVYYSLSDDNRNYSQSIELRFKSNAVTAKPRIVVLKQESDTEEAKANEKLNVQGELSLHQLPTNHDLQTESKLLLKFEPGDEVVNGAILSVLPTGIEGTAKVKFRIEVDRKEVAEHVKLRNWVPVSIEIGAFKVSGIKFVFVLE
jgi:hypothetical protein